MVTKVISPRLGRRGHRHPGGTPIDPSWFQRCFSQKQSLWPGGLERACVHTCSSSRTFLDGHLTGTESIFDLLYLFRISLLDISAVVAWELKGFCQIPFASQCEPERTHLPSSVLCATAVVRMHLTVR